MTVLQKRGNDCGAACLKMILSAHGIESDAAYLAYQLETAGSGTSMLNLRLVALGYGVPGRSWVLDAGSLLSAPFPAIAFIRANHFVVIRRFVSPDVLEVNDPALGDLHWPLTSFKKLWRGEILVFDPQWSPAGLPWRNTIPVRLSGGCAY